jgi:hypothetical protein
MRYSFMPGALMGGHQMFRLTVRYARYLLATLSGVGFGTSFN